MPFSHEFNSYLSLTNNTYQFSLPFDTIINFFNDGVEASSYNKLLRLLRFPRLYRLLKILRLFKMIKLFARNQTFNRIIKQLNLNMGLVKMLKVLINILFLNHLVGCMWFFIVSVLKKGGYEYVVVGV